MVGSRWVKADLHVHTRNSEEARNQGTILEIIQKAAAEGITVLGITDHNSGEGIDEAIKTAEEFNAESAEESVTVVPGVEISTEGGHILGLFGIGKNTEFIRTFLNQVGIEPGEYGKNEVNANKTIPEIIEIIHDKGGLAIAAHIDADRSVFGVAGATLKKILSEGYLDGLEITEIGKIGDFQENCKSLCKNVLPMLHFSDAHVLDSIGPVFTYLKLDEIHDHALKICLQEWKNRVDYPGGDLAAEHLYIENIEIEGGFLTGLDVELHPNLNCVVGGKGVGKSLLVEFLRYALKNEPKVDELVTDMETKVAKQLGEDGKITVRFKEADGETKILTCVYSSEGEPERSMISETTGEETALSMQPQFFSQTEIIKIADDLLKVDDVLYEGLDFYEEKAAIEECRTALNKNGYSISTMIGEKDVLDGYLKDINDGIKPTNERIKYLQHKIKEYGSVITAYNEYEVLDKKVEKLKEDLAVLRYYPKEAIEKAIPDIDYYETIKNIVANTGIATEVLEIQGPRTKITSEFEEVYNSAVSSFLSHVEPVIASWDTFFEKTKTEYEEALGTVEGGSLDIEDWNRELTEKKQKLGELNADKKRISDIEEELIIKRTERELLRGRFDAAIIKLRAKKERRNKKIRGLLKGNINIGLKEFANRAGFRSELATLGEGSYLRPEDYGVLAGVFMPTELVKIYEHYLEFATIPEQYDDPSIREKLLRLFETWDEKWELEEVFKLDTLLIEDIVDVKYKVGDVFKNLDELSVGQKSTAMISLAMALGREPLIIDQPEDALDSLFIYDRIVKDIKIKKGKRQFILVSHNANVVVNGDADFCVVLDATESHGRVIESGGIEKIRVNSEILRRLEGGPDAFIGRRKKYYEPV